MAVVRSVRGNIIPAVAALGRRLRRSSPATHALFLLIAVAIALFVVSRILGWPPPPGTFIGALGFIAAFLTVHPVTPERPPRLRLYVPAGPRPIRSPEEVAEAARLNAREERRTNAYVAWVKGSAIAFSFLLVVFELWAISSDRRATEASVSRQLQNTQTAIDKAQQQIEISAKQLDVTYSQTLAAHNTVGGLESLTRAMTLLAQPMKHPSSLKARTAHLAAEMILWRTSDELGQPIDTFQIKGGAFEKYRDLREAIFIGHFEARFKGIVKDILPALQRQSVPITPYIYYLTTWVGDEWGNSARNEDRLVTLADMLEDK